MTIATIETTLELWVSSLLGLKRRIIGLFAQERNVRFAIVAPHLRHSRLC